MGPVRRHDDRPAITAEKFADLLARLDGDPDQAGLEYERLRRALIRFFDWRGPWPPDECADECLDRLTRRLADGEPILDVRQYAHGIARLVLLERRRQPALSSFDAASDATKASPAPVPDEHSSRHECFDRCLAQLPPDSRSLLLNYYEGERDQKIANRRRLSQAIGLSENALRSRIQRLRDRLESCVQTCVSESNRGWL